MAFTFIDGPAKDQRILLKRGVYFLRVTEQNGKWDGLDQPDDKPEPGEKLYAYQMHKHHGTCHLNFGGGKGGFYPMIEYTFVVDQPPDTVMRDAARWRQWCLANAPQAIPQEQPVRVRRRPK